MIATRELEVLEEVRRPGQDVAQAVRSHLGNEMGDAADSLLAAVLYFGRAERIANADARRKAAGLRTDAATDERVKKWNEKGLLRMPAAISAVKRFGASTGAPTPEALAEVSDVVDCLKNFLADSELKPTDVAKLAKTLDEVGAAIKGGDKAIADYVSKKLSDLENARRQPDRGTSDNIPIWKLLAVAAFVGLALFVIFRCVVKKVDCAAAVAAAIAAGTTIEKLVALLC
jgi:hypothetical protein